MEEIHFFGKIRLNSISEVHWFSSGVTIEKAVMTKNYVRFKLAYSSPLLQDLLLSDFGLSGELPASSQLANTSASHSLEDISQLLFLCHKKLSSYPLFYHAREMVFLLVAGNRGNVFVFFWIALWTLKSSSSRRISFFYQGRDYQSFRQK